MYIFTCGVARRSKSFRWKTNKSGRVNIKSITFVASFEMLLTVKLNFPGKEPWKNNYEVLSEHRFPRRKGGNCICNFHRFSMLLVNYLVNLDFLENISSSSYQKITNF